MCRPTASNSAVARLVADRISAAVAHPRLCIAARRLVDLVITLLEFRPAHKAMLPALPCELSRLTRRGHTAFVTMHQSKLVLVHQRSPLCRRFPTAGTSKGCMLCRGIFERARAASGKDSKRWAARRRGFLHRPVDPTAMDPMQADRQITCYRYRAEIKGNSLRRQLANGRELEFVPGRMSAPVAASRLRKPKLACGVCGQTASRSNGCSSTRRPSGLVPARMTLS